MKKPERLEDARYLDFSGGRNTDMAIRELREAKKCRQDRESKFDISLISGSEIDEYVKSVAEEINLRTKATTYTAFEIGKLLWDVKNLLPHGEFLKWISGNLAISPSSAQTYMRIYDCCMGVPEILGCFNLSILSEICTPRFPENLRELLFENVEGIFDVKREDLLILAFKFRNGTVKIDSEEVQNFLKIEKEKAEFNKYKSKLNSLKNILQKQHEEFKELNKKVTSYPILKKEDNAKNGKYFEIEEMLYRFINETNEMIETLQREE